MIFRPRIPRCPETVACPPFRGSDCPKRDGTGVRNCIHVVDLWRGSACCVCGPGAKPYASLILPAPGMKPARIAFTKTAACCTAQTACSDSTASPL